LGGKVNGRELQDRLDDILGESEDDTWAEWWPEYTGSNAFFHTLSGETGYGSDFKLPEGVVDKVDGGLHVKGLGFFKKVEVYTDNYNTYEGRADTNLVFEFDGNTYRVEGTFDSHDGGVWGGIEDVKAVEKTITVWERA
jgi:hypothetical protein